MNTKSIKACGDNIGVYYDKSEYAGFIKRVAIAVIDAVVIVTVVVIISFLPERFITGQEAFIKFIFLTFILISIFYLGFLKRSRYRTLGYILTGVRIVDLKGERPSLFKMVLRTLILVVGPFEIFLDIMWLTSEETKQTLRDKFIGTYVVNLDAKPLGYRALKNVTLDVMGWHLTYREIKMPKTKN